MPFKRVQGLVTAKRKRADGDTHFSVECTFAIDVDENNDPIVSIAAEHISCRCLQLILTNSTVLLPSGLSHADILTLSSSQSIIEGYGRTLERPSDQRPAIELKTLTVFRVARYPQQIRFVASLAEQVTIRDSESLLTYLNFLISPRDQSDTPADNYLSQILSNEITVKSHCHFLTDYSSCASRSAPKQQRAGNHRAPRRRERKATEAERQVVSLLEERAAERLSAVVRGSVVTLGCSGLEGVGEGEERGQHGGKGNCCNDTCASSAAGDDGFLNIPDNNAHMKSHRGALTRGDYLHGKKAPQVEWVSRRLLALMAERGLGAGDSVQVVDVGGGRGDLGVAIALHLLREGFEQARVRVVDINGSSLNAGRTYADKMGVGAMMRFDEMDFDDAIANGDKVVPNLFVVALHACGSLTDKALLYAARRGAGFCIVPCCFSKISLRHSYSSWCIDLDEVIDSRCPPLGDRPSEECSRGGTDAKVEEVVRVLGRVAESEPRALSWRTMRGINVLRLCRVCASLRPDCTNPSWLVGLETFPKAYSMRNMALCGTLVEH